VQPGHFPQKSPVLGVNANGSLAAGPVAGVWGSFELQSSILAKEKRCTNMVQVVLLDTEANIPKYRITTTNYTPKRSVDMTPPPSAPAGSGVDPGAKDRVFVITALKRKGNDHDLEQ